MNYNVFVLCLMFVSVCVTQNEEAGDGTNSVGVQTEVEQLGTEMKIDEEGNTTVSPVCSVCRCSEHYVDCSEREISRIFEDDDWAGLNDTDIMDLDFSGNPLNVLSIVPDLPINRLNLSRCNIADIDDVAFENLEELGSLDLSSNQLSTAAISKRIFGMTFIPGKGKPAFPNIQNLSLAYNDIHALPKDIFMFMSSLKMLDLSGNPLSFIDQVTMVALSDLKLTELKLASCELESLPEGIFRRQRKLQRLDISDNRFSTVPAVLGEAPSLVYLNFNKNSLTNLTERTAISNLTNLQELHLCRQSKMQYIAAGALGGLESLTTLYITHNPRLISIDPGFLVYEDEHGSEVTPLLEQLYLNNNNISSISFEFLDSWNQLTRADFSNNPYVCDCTNQWMVDVLVPLINRIEGTAANMICKRPLDMGGLSFETLQQTNRTLVCLDMAEMNATPGPDMAILLGVMIGIFVTFPIVLIVVLLWKNGYFERCRRKIRSEPVSEYDEDDAF